MIIFHDGSICGLFVTAEKQQWQILQSVVDSKQTKPDLKDRTIVEKNRSGSPHGLKLHYNEEKWPKVG